MFQAELLCFIFNDYDLLFYSTFNYLALVFIHIVLGHPGRSAIVFKKHDLMNNKVIQDLLKCDKCKNPKPARTYLCSPT
jgi:hypothetical protein